MERITIIQTACVLTACLPLWAGGCSARYSRATIGETPVGDPVRTYGVGRANNVHRDGGVYITSQPDRRTIRAMARRGGGLVINLRTDEEMGRLDYDEPALVEALAMEYVHIPMRGRELTPSVVDEFAALVQDQDRPVLLHCASGGRAAMLWSAYLHRHRGVPLDDALAAARSMGLSREIYIEITRQVALGETPVLTPEEHPELFPELFPEAEDAPESPAQREGGTPDGG